MMVYWALFLVMNIFCMEEQEVEPSRVPSLKTLASAAILDHVRAHNLDKTIKDIKKKLPKDLREIFETEAQQLCEGVTAPSCTVFNHSSNSGIFPDLNISTKEHKYFVEARIHDETNEKVSRVITLPLATMPQYALLMTNYIIFHDSKKDCAVYHRSTDKVSSYHFETGIDVIKIAHDDNHLLILDKQKKIRLWNIEKNLFVELPLQSDKTISTLVKDGTTNDQFFLFHEDATCDHYHYSDGWKLIKTLSTEFVPSYAEHTGNRLVLINNKKVHIIDYDEGTVIFKKDFEHTVKKAYFYPLLQRVITITHSDTMQYAT